MDYKVLTPLKQLAMKAQTTRTPPNYGLILIIVTSVLFWLGILKVFFGQQIKDWIMSIFSVIG